MFRLPIRSRRLRWLTLGYGLVVFLWISPEDNRVTPVAVLGLGLSALLVILAITGKAGGRQIPARYVIPGGVVLGAIMGVGAAITTTGLMLIKNGLHAHLFLDYPPGLMLAILERAPGWGVAGGLIGLSLAFIWLARSKQHPPI
jgi:hypothetical protein